MSSVDNNGEEANVEASSDQDGNSEVSSVASAPPTVNPTNEEQATPPPPPTPPPPLEESRESTPPILNRPSKRPNKRDHEVKKGKVVV